VFNIPAYTSTDWQLEWDAGQKLRCPRCGSDEDFGPRQSVQPDRSFRHFRACKRCGLFQDADGHSEWYQTVLLVHKCQTRGADAQCKSCGRRPRSSEHDCARIVREGESFVCPECGITVGNEHMHPWPESGPWT
jgi:predicted RNA-binding Zn-ribbon protein involved in translation (DUF1610 family)